MNKINIKFDFMEFNFSYWICEVVHKLNCHVRLYLLSRGESTLYQKSTGLLKKSSNNLVFSCFLQDYWARG